MRKRLLLSCLVILSVVFLSHCGGGGNHPVQPVPTTNSFAFLEEAPPGSEGRMQVLLGGFKGNKFVTKSVIDSSTGKPVTADLHSIILSLDGRKATFDVWPGVGTYARAAQSSIYPDIFVANADSTNLVQITHGETYVAFPSFSPDSTKVIFLASNSSSPYDTMIANVDGTNMVSLTAGSPICHHEPVFSPDGTKILFAGHTWSSGMDIYLMNADGTNPVNLTNETDYYTENRLPMFSPDGSKIVFTKVIYGETNTADIYSMNSDGSGPTRVTTTGVDWHARYLGSELTVSSYRDGNMEIYKMAGDGTAPTRLTNNTVYDAFTADEFYSNSSLKQPSRFHIQTR